MGRERSKLRKPRKKVSTTRTHGAPAKKKVRVQLQGRDQKKYTLAKLRAVKKTGESRKYFGDRKTTRGRRILNIAFARLLGANVPKYGIEVIEPPKIPYACGVMGNEGRVKFSFGHGFQPAVPSKATLSDLHRQLLNNPASFTHIYTDGSYHERHGTSGYAVYWGSGHEWNAYGPVPTNGPLSSAKAEEYAILLAMMQLRALVQINEDQYDDSFSSEDNSSDVIDLTTDDESSRPAVPEGEPKRHTTMTRKRFCIYCDSSWVLEDIRRWYKRWSSPTCYVAWKDKPRASEEHNEILRVAAGLLWELRQCGVEILLNYVKGHSGIPGNEAADRMAKRGSLAGKHYGFIPALYHH